MEGVSSDAERIEAERVQKLNSVMSHFGFEQQQPAPDTSTLLSSKDVEQLRASVLQRPPDSYIIAATQWLFRSVKASLASTFAPPRQFGNQASSSQHPMSAEEQEAERLRREAEAADAERRSQAVENRVSSEGRRLKLSLTDEEAKTLHPKIADARAEILEMEKSSHVTLDNIFRARLRYLALPDAEPPCTAEMRTVADCYAQFAGRKYEAAQHLEKQAQTPDIIKREQQRRSSNSDAAAAPKAGNKKGNSNKVDPYGDLPEELLAGGEMLKLSTSVLSCREVAKKLDQCAEQAGLQHVQRHQRV